MSGTSSEEIRSRIQALVFESDQAQALVMAKEALAKFAKLNLDGGDGVEAYKAPEYQAQGTQARGARTQGAQALEAQEAQIQAQTQRLEAHRLLAPIPFRAQALNPAQRQALFQAQIDAQTQKSMATQDHDYLAQGYRTPTKTVPLQALLEAQTHAWFQAHITDQAQTKSKNPARILSQDQVVILAQGVQAPPPPQGAQNPDPDIRIKNLELKLAGSYSENQRLRAQLNVKDQDIVDLRQAVEDRTDPLFAKKYFEKHSKTYQDMRELQVELYSTKEQLRTTEDDLKAEKEKNAEKERILAENEKLKAELKEKDQKISSLDQALEDRKDPLFAKKYFEKHSRAYQTAKELQVELYAATERLRTTNKDLRAEKEKNAELERILAVHENDLYHNQDELAKMTENFRAEEKNNQILTGKIEELTKSLSAKEAELQKVQKKYTEMFFEVQAVAKFKIQAEYVARHQAESKAKPEAKSEEEAPVQAETQAETQAQSQAQPQAPLQAETQAQVQAQPQAPLQAPLQAQPQAQPDDLKAKLETAEKQIKSLKSELKFETQLRQKYSEWNGALKSISNQVDYNNSDWSNFMQGRNIDEFVDFLIQSKENALENEISWNMEKKKMNEQKEAFKSTISTLKSTLYETTDALKQEKILSNSRLYQLQCSKNEPKEPVASGAELRQKLEALGKQMKENKRLASETLEVMKID